MPNLKLKENSRLSLKIKAIEELMEKGKLKLLISRGKRPELLISDGSRYFIYVSQTNKRISEFPPEMIGNYYLCDQKGNIYQQTK